MRRATPASRLRYHRSMDAPDPHDELDPLVEALVRDVDMTLIRRNLLLTPQERLDQLVAMQQFAAELAEAGRRARGRR